MQSTVLCEPVLNTLAAKPSRASAAAVGHHYVLNGVPPAMRVRGLRVLCEMPCDWTSVILESAIKDETLEYRFRRQALTQLQNLLWRAIRMGYRNLSHGQCAALTGLAVKSLPRESPGSASDGIDAVEELCCHLAQAVDDGLFGELPDF
jgi:hypothetical protein